MKKLLSLLVPAPAAWPGCGPDAPGEIYRTLFRHRRAGNAAQRCPGQHHPGPGHPGVRFRPVPAGYARATTTLASSATRAGPAAPCTRTMMPGTSVSACTTRRPKVSGTIRTSCATGTATSSSSTWTYGLQGLGLRPQAGRLCHGPQVCRQTHQIHRGLQPLPLRHRSRGGEAALPEAPHKIEEPVAVRPGRVRDGPVQPSEDFHFPLSRQLYSLNGVPFVYAMEGETYSSIAK